MLHLSLRDSRVYQVMINVSVGFPITFFALQKDFSFNTDFDWHPKPLLYENLCSKIVTNYETLFKELSTFCLVHRVGVEPT
jgi:hypothetical protein